MSLETLRLPIFLLFGLTDFLNNRDSLAFLRLSQDLWAAHSSSSGCYRYRLKIPAEETKTWRPSDFPTDSFRSLYAGFYSLSGIFLKESIDFSLMASKKISSYLPPSIDGLDKRIFLSKILIQLEGMEEFLVSSNDLANGFLNTRFDFPLVETISFMGSWQRPLQDLLSFLPETVKILDFHRMSCFSPDPVGFSRFSHLSVLKLSDSFLFPLWPGIFPTGLRELQMGRSFHQEISENILPEALEKFSLINGSLTGEFSLPQT